MLHQNAGIEAGARETWPIMHRFLGKPAEEPAA
jgi:hypothetical protein